MGSERETFIKLNDHMPEHPKIEGLSDKAFRAAVELWCWCSRTRSDGHVPPGTWKKRAPGKTGRELIEAGLAHPADDGGVDMHDYLKHQRSKAHIEAVSQKRAVAGQRGGKVRPSAKQDGSKVLSKSEAEGTPEDRGGTTYLPDRGSEQDAPAPSSRAPATSSPGATARAARQRGKRIPPDFAVTDGMRAWAREKGLRCDLDRETEKFINYWTAKAGRDATKTDWMATWRNWVLKADEDAGGGRRPVDTRAVADIPDDQIDPDKVLGPETWEPPAPEHDLGLEDRRTYYRDAWATHRAERVTAARRALEQRRGA